MGEKHYSNKCFASYAFFIYFLAETYFYVCIFLSLYFETRIYEKYRALTYEKNMEICRNYFKKSRFCVHNL